MIKSGLYSVIVQNVDGDELTAGNFTVVNTVDNDFDIVVGGDGSTLWNGYARAEFGMITFEVEVSSMNGMSALYDAASIDISAAAYYDLNDGYKLDLPGFVSRKPRDGIAAVFSVDEQVVFTIVREFDIETVE